MGETTVHTHDGGEITLKTQEGKPVEYRFSVEFYVFQENGVYIAYCPSLDISTSGKNFNDAVTNFHERLQIHIEWCIEHNTLVDDLANHGWKMTKKAITPPSFSHLLKNKDMRHLLAGGIAYEKVITPARVHSLVGKQINISIL